MHQPGHARGKPQPPTALVTLMTCRGLLRAGCSLLRLPSSFLPKYDLIKFWGGCITNPDAADTLSIDRYAAAGQRRDLILIALVVRMAVYAAQIARIINIDALPQRIRERSLPVVAATKITGDAG